jgi:type IV conjugative transfer system protein TraL
MREGEGYIPKNLDNVVRWAFWDIYQGVLFLTFVGIGAIVHQLFLSIILGSVLAWAYGKIASGNPKGFLLRFLYWYFPFSGGFKSIPESYKRNFLG